MLILHSLTDPQVTSTLKQGGVIVLPTDTQYGLVASAHNAQAIERLYQVKAGRDHKPGTFIAASIDQLVDLGLKARYLKPVERFWPNPVSVVIPAGPELQHLHRGAGGLAVRIPKDSELQQLLEKTGPLVTSSANTPGDSPATTITEAQAYFGDKVDFYVDGGDLGSRLPSTVIRIVDDAVEVVRPGAVAIDEASGEIIDP